MLSELGRAAVDAIIEFAHDVYAKVFSFAQAKAVHDYVVSGKVDAPDNEASFLLYVVRPFLLKEEHLKADKEVWNVVDNYLKYEKAEEQRIEDAPSIKHGRH